MRGVCPRHGDVDAFSAWLVDPLTHPRQVQCKQGGEWYPDAAHPLNLDADGDGAHDAHRAADGKTYYFLAEYAHHAYTAVTIPALRSFSQAHVLLRDAADPADRDLAAKSARKGAILLARLAKEYPKRDGQYYAALNQRGGTVPGVITDYIWETFCLEATAIAYDGLYDYLGGLDASSDVLAFLRSVGVPVQTGAELQRYIERELFHYGMRYMLEGRRIRGNEGMHQHAALACALVLDDWQPSPAGTTPPKPTSRDMLEYVYHGVGHMAHFLDNGLWPDGGGHESPGYNALKWQMFLAARLAEEIRALRPAHMPADRYPEVLDAPKAKRFFDHMIDLTVQDAFVPKIGDSGGIAAPVRQTRRRWTLLRQHAYLFAFQKYGDVRFAEACRKEVGSPDFVNGELFEHYPDAELRNALAASAASPTRTSRLLDGYGVGVLRSGAPGARGSAMLNYTSLRGHRQNDNLSLELYRDGVDLLPDLGYPFSWTYRWQFDSNSLAHNTVTVDETQPAHGIGGAARLFAETDGVHVLTAAHDPYPRHDATKPDGTDLYERTVLMVDVGPNRFYLVDLFAVSGGTQHDQSWHGLLTPVESPALAWRSQPGTLAGPAVPQFGTWTDRWGRTRDDFPSYVTGVRCAQLDAPATWTWRSGLADKRDGLRLHLVPVGGPLTVLQGTATTPVRPSGWGLDYIIARRHAPGGRASRFLTVIEPTQRDRPLVQSVRTLPQPTGVQGIIARRHGLVTLFVERLGGVDEIRLRVPTGSSREHGHRALGVRVISRTATGRVVRDVKIGDLGGPVRTQRAPRTRRAQRRAERRRGSPGPSAPGYGFATILSVDYANHEILCRASDVAARQLAPGRSMRIFNEHRSAMVQITDAVSLSQWRPSFWRPRQPVDQLLRLTVASTALLGRGEVIDAKRSRLDIGAYLPFATGKRNALGNLKSGQLELKGARLGEGTGAPVIHGAISNRDEERSAIVLLRGTVADALGSTPMGKTVSIWAYGAGDTIEVPEVSAMPRPAGGGPASAAPSSPASRP
jgi:hypothetical protein